MSCLIQLLSYVACRPSHEPETFVLVLFLFLLLDFRPFLEEKEKEDEDESLSCSCTKGTMVRLDPPLGGSYIVEP